MSNNVLERSGVLPPPYTTRAVDGADLAASIAVATAVGHALGSGVRVEVGIGGGRGARHGRRNGEAVLGRHPGLVHGWSAEVVGVIADLVGDNGDGIGSIGLASE
jgi:hypothetical protein